MARFKRIPQAEEGKLIYSDVILDNIVLYAVKEIPFITIEGSEDGSTRSKSIYVRKEKEGVHVDIDINIHYAQSVSDTAFKIQEAVRHAIENMTEYRVASVNVNVIGVFFEDKVEEPQNANNANNQEG